jgi:hypothetical protein
MTLNPNHELESATAPGGDPMRMLSHVLTLLRARSLKHCFVLLAVVSVFSPAALTAQTALPRPEHIVIVIEENHSYDQIMKAVKNNDAPYLKSLMSQGATFTSFFALHHPSQPNYLVLFSGDRQGVKGNGCIKEQLTAPSLGGELIKKQLTALGPGGEPVTKQLTFRGYADGLPSAGSTACDPGQYARKHVPWTNFADVQPQEKLSLPFTAFPPDFNDLPTVAIVIPDLGNDMHDGSVTKADTWLKEKLGAYVEWAKTNNSLLIITWDEDNRKSFLWFNRTTKPPKNRIPTIFVGPMVEPRPSDKQYTHLDLLRTLEEMYGLPLLGASKNATIITDVWK